MIHLEVPSSKSLTQRALILAALAETRTTIVSPLNCDDSNVLIIALRQLGVRIEKESDRWHVTPPVKFQTPGKPLYLGNAGTAVRFLTGLAPLIPGAMVIDGSEAMHRRPMPGLLVVLQEMGIGIEELGKPNCPPIRLSRPDRLTLPRAVTLTAGGSSQELSALLMAGCCFPAGLAVTLVGELPSRPYIDLTIEALADFGIEVERPGEQSFIVPAKRPNALREIHLEGDWSSAGYPLAAGWLTSREVTITNVDEDSLQGDRAILRYLGELSAPGPRHFDLGDTPDLTPTIVACALFADGPTTISGVAHLRLKESDRLAGLARELVKLGARLKELPDGLIVEPRPLAGPAALDPQHDHRLAMAFGLVSLRVPDLEILTPSCVSKSYPFFWGMLRKFKEELVA